jgi:hypothetical protein
MPPDPRPEALPDAQPAPNVPGAPPPDRPEVDPPAEDPVPERTAGEDPGFAPPDPRLLVDFF